jgi:hypothetical protein
MDSLEALQGLHRDLLILTESRLPSLQRLSEELDSQLEDFRALLSKSPRKEESRKIVQSGQSSHVTFRIHTHNNQERSKSTTKSIS